MIVIYLFVAVWVGFLWGHQVGRREEHLTAEHWREAYERSRATLPRPGKKPDGGLSTRVQVKAEPPKVMAVGAGARR